MTVCEIELCVLSSLMWESVSVKRQCVRQGFVARTSELDWQWGDFLITCPLYLMSSAGCPPDYFGMCSALCHLVTAHSQPQVWAPQRAVLLLLLLQNIMQTPTSLVCNRSIQIRRGFFGAAYQRDFEAYVVVRELIWSSHPVTYLSLPPVSHYTPSVGLLSRQEILLVSGPCAYCITTQWSTPSSH